MDNETSPAPKRAISRRALIIAGLLIILIPLSIEALTGRLYARYLGYRLEYATDYRAAGVYLQEIEAMGPRAAAARASLVRCLKKYNPSLIYAAMKKTGMSAKEVYQLEAHADDPQVRAWGAGNLANLGVQGDTSVVADLIPLLHDPSSLVCQQATLGLGNMGPRANAAIPNLKLLTTSKDAERASNAAYVLRQIEPAASP